MTANSPNISGTVGTRNGRESQSARVRGALRVPTPFPDAWESYDYAKPAEGLAGTSNKTRCTSVLRLAKMYPDQDPDTLTRRQVEKHITAMTMTLKPNTVYGSFCDLRSFFAWLAEDAVGMSLRGRMRSPGTGELGP
jgi:hypothetical protein